MERLNDQKTSKILSKCNLAGKRNTGRPQKTWKYKFLSKLEYHIVIIGCQTCCSKFICRENNINI